MAPNVPAHDDALYNSHASSSFLLSHHRPSTPRRTPPPSHHAQQQHPCHMDSSQLVAHDQFFTQGAEMLPLVDLGLLCHADKAEVQKLVMAVKEWGFFEVANSGVPLKLLSEIEEQVSHVFALPLEAKTRAEPAAGSFHGYLTKSSGEDGKMLQLSEALRLPLNPQHRSDMIIQFWPEGNEAFSSVVEKYIAAVDTVLLQLLKSLALGLGLDPLQFTRNLSNDANFSALRMNIYPASSQSSPTLGLVAHSDASILTILHQSSVAGLQIRKDEKWIAIKPRLGFFVVNVGDMLQVMSNDLFPSVVHRVVKNNNKCRSSVAFIKVTHPEFIVGPVPELVSQQQRTSPYHPFTAEEYYTSMTSHGLLDGKSNLDRFRISPTVEHQRITHLQRKSTIQV
ncbi:hypothetical protein O6H91_06G029000 [Diphasiastrum complanatum]|uniref:Uncharacterized protein n=3 Tax=Diphasiastrum complanatum TaxID=34168 RepID=A0ACC2DCF0_DIPCM|nr:hypothetical protein O6H91_06G028800 [Diphasiastrum complanatum]KAJ7551797.1 hypothetical protein O6H91_06G028900 [Diphasiastrum complanatum]KAJ7551798.1 hypothetical protein O6H91_06G029000 [Diphasiastrum complanatum]